MASSSQWGRMRSIAAAAWLAATNLFALRRLRDEGAKTALVACRADDAHSPASCALYDSVGFRETRRLVTFTRTQPS